MLIVGVRKENNRSLERVTSSSQAVAAFINSGL